MRYFNMAMLRYFFNTICIIMLMFMAGFWLWKFAIEDRDIGVVDYVAFENALDIDLPSTTFCFQDPFLRNQLELHKPEINLSSYHQYLSGDAISEALQNVDYENISINLKDYFIAAYIRLRNETGFRNATVLHKVNFNGYHLQSQFIKCFEVALDMPQFQNVVNLYLYYDNKRLVDDTYTDDNNMEFWAAIHYPGQFLLSLQFSFGHWADVAPIEYDIKDIEIIRGRNSRKRSCTPHTDINSFDDMVQEKHAVSKGCTAPYLQRIEGIPRCSTKEAIKHAMYDWSTVGKKYYPACCQRISKIMYQTFVYSKETFYVTVTYPEYARVIEQSKDVDIHALIGNIGGYVGLFPGI